MIEVGKRYLERGTLRAVTVRERVEAPFTGIPLVLFSYVDEPDLKRRLTESDFEKLTLPAVT
ncbi:MAG TPA: hypothetical protein PLS53_00210 [Thermoanaerobaculaceae bacterium]|nr:hypothetical protein [Thermoanaerobaculaceae bacterium]